MDLGVPTFEDWVDYVFTFGYPDFAGTSNLDDESQLARQLRYQLQPMVEIEYLTRLFEAPAFVADRFSDQQIGEATWFIFGVGSGYMERVRSDRVPLEPRVRCVRAIATTYTDLFDRVCGLRGEEPDMDRRDLEPDKSVYMIWDMDGIQYALSANENDPLSLACFDVLHAGLMKCITSACRVSALHGLGHGISRMRTGSPMVARAQSMIDEFLAKRRLPEWLREYALAARTGYLQ